MVLVGGFDVALGGGGSMIFHELSRVSVVFFFGCPQILIF